MKKKYFLLTALIITITMMALRSLSSDELPESEKNSANIPHIAENLMPLNVSASSSSIPASLPQKQTLQEVTKTAEEELWDETAIEQLRDARLHGDDRAPPIVHETTIEQRATPEELASPEQYNAYEAREEMRLKANFVSAAQPRLMELQQQIQAMRNAGIDKEAIREAEEKLIQLNAMNQQLQKQHPDINQQSSRPATQDNNAPQP